MTSAPASAAGVCVRVPAKVNVELRVGPPRADGFHPVATVYQAVSLYDTVWVTPAADWSVELSGRTTSGVPADDSNLAVRAAMELAKAAGVRERAVVHIGKEIPVAGGMAGGSADAAAALVACNRLWGLDWGIERLEPIAARLGSDIPFLLHGGTALGSGRGEQVVPALTRGTYHWVFALSHGGLSTPAVYAECDRLRGSSLVPDPQPSPQLLSALRSGDVVGVAALLANDLQAAAVSLHPGLGEVLDAGLRFGALGGIVSGSGPTIAFLAAGHEAALDLAVALTASGTAADVRRAVGPTVGAHVDVVAGA
ncbi:MAG: 4-(cytidine 5'-diphospho)-2-C-methyl-D-erythritol kinase [Tetrasphaera sp.]